MTNSRTSRRQFLAGAVPAVALVGAAGAGSKSGPPHIARMIAEFDRALDHSIRAEAKFLAANAADTSDDFDAECDREDAFLAVHSHMLEAGDRLAKVVRAIRPDADAIVTHVAVYAFDEADNHLYCEVRRIDLERCVKA